MKMFDINKVENLVFAGGGVKVIAYAGALKALEQGNHLAHIRKVAGASGGAISALCLSLGYNAQEIESVLKNLDFTKFSQDSDNHTSVTYGLWDTVKEKLNEIAQGVWDSTKHGFSLVWKFLDNGGGIHSGDYLQEFVEKLLSDKGFDKSTTFKQLHDNPNTIIDLYVVTSNLNSQCPEIFSYENTPDREVRYAVHASSAFPIYFKPKYDDEKIMHSDSKLYFNYHVDGGLFFNYPITVFDNSNPWLPSGSQADYYQTLGFKTVSSKVLDWYKKGIKPPPFYDVTFPINFLYAIAEAVMSNDIPLALSNNTRTVFIDDVEIKTLNFNITNDQKQQLIDSGYSLTIDFLNNTPSLSLLGTENLDSSFAT